MLKTKKKLETLAVILNPGADNVAIAKEDISSGTVLEHNGTIIEINSDIKNGHRFASSNIKDGDFIRQYGYPFAQSKGIFKGDPVKVSNVRNIIPDTNENKYKEPSKTVLREEYVNKTFLGFPRKESRPGTRNYYLVIPTSMCSSEVALQVALNLDNDKNLLDKYKNIDGIVAIPHTEGCGCDSGLQIERLIKVLRGYCLHPNVGGCIMIDLGCEQTNYERLYPLFHDILKKDIKPVDWITIQESGGTRSATEKAKEIIKKILPTVNNVAREPFPISMLAVGTECGASDSFSGITANPLIGNVVDKVIYGNGSAILSEVTEMVGVFGMFMPRFRSREIMSKFKHLLEWYTGLARRLGLTIEPNLVPKNIEGGLINNYIKSLGAVIKGGTTSIEDVIDYADPLEKKGLTIMQGPGNDPESITGMVASGVNIICFSTGKGTITGDAICPVIKIASNADTFKNLPEDMDFDGSRVLKEDKGLDGIGEELFSKVIKVASGEKTWSEKWKQRQFQVWTAGKLSL